MKRLLDELYDLEMFHTDTENMGEEYKEALDRLVKAETELLKAFPDSKEILDTYQSADIDLHSITNRAEFIRGVKVGAQLILEMLNPIK